MQHDARTALASVPEEQLKRMILDLGRYALSVSRRLRWRTGNAAELPRGETIESIVSLAFTKVLAGERRWNPIQDPDLKTYLMNVIDSLLNHLAEHSDNTVLAAMPASRDHAEAIPERQWRSAPAAWQAQPPPSPEAALLRREARQRDQQTLQRLAEDSRHDPVLTQVLDAMRNGCGKPADMAARTNLPVQEIYKAIKRLDRKLIRLRQSLRETRGNRHHAEA